MHRLALLAACIVVSSTNWMGAQPNETSTTQGYINTGPDTTQTLLSVGEVISHPVVDTIYTSQTEWQKDPARNKWSKVSTGYAVHDNGATTPISIRTSRYTNITRGITLPSTN